MKVRREAAGRRDEIDDRRRAVHRLERADAEQNVRGRPSARTPTLSRRRTSRATTTGRQIAAVGAEVDAGQRDLLEAGRRDPLDLGQDFVERARFAAARASSG